jgi:hypothetical protein
MRGGPDLDPISAAAGAIGPIEVLRDDALETHIAGDLEQHVANVALLVFRDEMPST